MRTTGNLTADVGTVARWVDQAERGRATRVSVLGYVNDAQRADIQAGLASVDVSSAINAAIAAAYALGGGEVYLPSGTYLCAASTGTWELPRDDGSVEDGHGDSLQAEAATTMPYSILLKRGVRLVGDGRDCTIIKAGWTYGTSGINTSQKATVLVENANSGEASYVGVSGIQFRDCFMPIAWCGILTRSEFHAIGFRDCAFSVVGMAAERIAYDDIEFIDTAAGIVHGGWWLHRNNTYTASYMPHPFSSSYTDKVTVSKLDYRNSRTHGDFEDDIDDFFDVYFFKTANNATRASTEIDVGDAVTLTPYKGVTDCALTFHARYNRPNFNNEFSSWFVFGAARYALNAGRTHCNNFRNFYCERIGFYNKSNYTDLAHGFGVGITNPYVAGRIEAVIYASTGAGSAALNIYADPVTADTIVSAGTSAQLGVQHNTALVTLKPGNLVGTTSYQGVQSFTGPFGYAAGAGGTQTQSTNKATTVVLDKLCGTITMNAANLAADTSVSFTLTNSEIAANDIVHVVHNSEGTLGAYGFAATPAAGSALITVHNNTPGGLAEAIVLRFIVIKAVVA